MSDTHITDAADIAPTASPGEQLKRERESQGLSRDEVAESLNLRPAVIRGLEEDNYEEVPVAAYRRGYLRSYAHLLGIDDRPVLEAYRARFGGEEQERKVTPVHVTRPPSRLGAWLFRLVTLLVIAGLLGLTLLWWQSRGGNEPPGVSESGPVSVDSLDGSTTITESGEAPATDDAPAADAAAETDALPPLPEEESDLGLVEDPDAAGEAPSGEVDPGAAHIIAAGSGPADDAEQETLVEEATDTGLPDPEAAPAPAADPRTLELTFNEQSWTEIFDANNERVFVGLQEPGTTASVEGEPPFRLTVGNATGVELVWAGEPVDLVARAGANNVARFTLGE
ncbi:RodZ domain-containing protein [Halomonas sp. C05BenzN]|uniref:RodZ domain-containing protein n=1 Tax=Halomonas sp. C05BenzN TaxID=3411041 RepID=UPI003B937B4A